METIRNRLSRKRKLLFLGTLIAFAFVVIGVILGTFLNKTFYAIAVIAFAAYMWFMYATYFLVRCPACGGNLGYALTWPITWDFSVSKKINFCQFCGISLDKEIDAENKS